MEEKLTKTEIAFNSDLQWFKKKGYLSKEGTKFADIYYDYCNRLMGIKSSKPTLR